MGSHEPPPFHWHYADLDDTSNYELRGRTLFFIVILFAILLLAALLFFYARWICHLRDLPSSSSSHTRPAALEAGLRRPRGLDIAKINALPIALYGSLSTAVKSVDGSETECSICLSLFEEEDKVKVLPDCNHWFHTECVDRWLVGQSSCPLCRSCLRFDESGTATATVIDSAALQIVTQ